MTTPDPISEQRQGALALLRMLRNLDQEIGVRHSGIALDVGLLLYERSGAALSVKEICALTRYSGPTVRLVMSRLAKAGMVGTVPHGGRTTAYALTEAGVAGFDGYIARIWEFGLAVAKGEMPRFIAAAAVGPDRGRRSDRRSAQDRHEGAPPAREAAD